MAMQVSATFDGDTPEGEALEEGTYNVPLKRTPFTPPSKVPFLPYGLMGAKKTVEWVDGEWVYDFPPEDCFEIMKDYKTFLQSHLSTNEKENSIFADPQWIKAGEDGIYGTVGSLCQYAFKLDNIVFWMVDEIVTLDDGTSVDR